MEPNNIPKGISAEDVVLAIDFGTSNSLASLASSDFVTSPLPLDPKASDPSVLRSILYFPHGDMCFYGNEAIVQYSENQGEGRLLRSIKKYLPTESYLGSKIDNRLVKLEDLIGFFLLEVKRRTSQFLDLDVKKALLGRPARFSGDDVGEGLAQYRLEKAAEIAGLEVIEYLPEPLAAAYSLRQSLKEEKVVLVVDLGGGTSDFTVIRLNPQQYSKEDVLALGGISIAGDALDGAIMRGKIAPYLGSEVQYRVPLGRNVLTMPKSLLDHISSAPDITQLSKRDFMEFFRQVQDWVLNEEDSRRMERLICLVDDQLGFAFFEAIEKCKRELSHKENTRFEFDYPDVELDFPVSKKEFENLVETNVEKILSNMDEVITQSGISPDQIDYIFCTGGTSRLPLIQKELAQRFGQNKLTRTEDFRSVVEGLAHRAQDLLTS
jgi:hypothetical chaperone protein